jgi:hypothetical protein
MGDEPREDDSGNDEHADFLARYTRGVLVCTAMSTEKRIRRRYNYTLDSATAERLREYAAANETTASRVVEEAVLRLIAAQAGA